MARESLLDALGDIARDKGIPRERLVAVIQEAVTQAAKRKFRQYQDLEARVNEHSGELEVFRYKVVAEDVSDPENEISLDEARRLDQLAEPGDEVEYEIDNKEVSRVIAQTARQLIFQKIREAERETIFENFKDRIGEVLNGIVSRTERGRTFITFNQTEAILYRREQIPHERYSPGDHIRVILLDVLNDPREPSQLVISRAHPMLLVKLFEMEVPEIYDGIVEIVAAAREPGRRAKIAVRSNDPDVDPVGACVGMRGSRVQAIISELRGEKIDIIHYAEDLPTYLANALAPAELSRVKIDQEGKVIDVEVEPDQLSLAIGRQGVNVRLASKLLDFRINVRGAEDQAPSLEEQIRQRLQAAQAEMGLSPAYPGGEQPAEGEAVEEVPPEGEDETRAFFPGAEPLGGTEGEAGVGVTAEAPVDPPAQQEAAAAPEAPVPPVETGPGAVPPAAPEEAAGGEEPAVPPVETGPGAGPEAPEEEAGGGDAAATDAGQPEQQADPADAAGEPAAGEAAQQDEAEETPATPAEDAGSAADEEQANPSERSEPL